MLKINISEDIANLTSRSASKRFGGNLYKAILGNLVSIDKHGNIQPEILEGWKMYEGGKVWLLKVKKLRFFNNRNLDSKDIAFSFLRYFLQSKNFVEKSYLKDIIGISKLDKNNLLSSNPIKGIEIISSIELKIILNFPNPNFIYLLEESCFAPVPNEELQKDGISWKNTPTGLGKYKISKLGTNNNSLWLEKKLVEKDVFVPNKILISSGSNDFDLDISGMPTKLKNSFKKNISIYTSAIVGIFFNYNNPICQSIEFRNAVRNSIDKLDISSKFDFLQPAWNFIPENHQEYINPYSESQREVGTDYFEKKYSKLLTPVNKLLTPVNIDIFRYDFNKQSNRWIVMIHEQLKNYGFSNKLNRTTKPPFQKNDNESFFWILKFIPSNYDPVILYKVFEVGGSWISSLSLDDDKFTFLIKEASSISLGNKRVREIKELYEHFKKLNYAIPLFEYKSLFCYNTKKIKNMAFADQGWKFDFSKIQMRC